ncbi:MAG: 2-hydroxychromene-2-carboxylate isomerase [Tistrella sp.]|uniref:2-hydroxychromene-2-carboxylate isomerase n=2 Tax=Tistrella TaxID=171436 RepID=A0A3B9IDK4_9PROT|nr:2-hydroxychromene-2-carboxylate isomerase [Tistrella sp.]MBA74578.1 2-hydroxychromene-2-carboxylate isomerase [Tistrella sp.]HAE45971.1 2-hydroxychromene-2-carboxylate isomerase [Tistrella mobilis]
MEKPMTAPIEFWFDFSSAYAYFASHEIEALAARHGRQVIWRPYMLGVAFKATGMRGLSGTPLKGDYARNDWRRISRETGIPFTLPPGHPIVALPASRAFYWIEARDPAAAVAFARDAFHAYYVEQADMTDPAVVAGVAARRGLDAEEVLAGMADPAIKEKVKTISEEGVARGVFGSPFVLVDDEPFWGWDRLAMVDRWLARGGW